MFHFRVYYHEKFLETTYKSVCVSAQYIFYYNRDTLIEKCHIY